MRYIDFDGVILDTEPLLFEIWRQNPDRDSLPVEAKISYIQNSDWNYILNSAQIINDAIYILKNMDPDENVILTKVSSLHNEGEAKIAYLKKHKVRQRIILVPYTNKKSEVVNPKGNILVDNTIHNLVDWELAGGYPMFFDLFDNNVDGWNVTNSQGYQRVRRIDEPYKGKLY